MSGRAIGIDLGTSNSAVAVIDRDGRPRILTTPEGATTMPSLVWFADEGPVVGEQAIAGLEEQPEHTVFAVKRLLGRPFQHPDVQALAKRLPYRLVPASNGDTLIELTGGRRVSPEEVSALVLRRLRQIAEHAFGEAVTEAVITVPAWFDSAQRQATKDAAAIAGLVVRRLISEPTAAALGFGAHRGVDRRYAVCDLGGGTFDVSMVDVERGHFEVLATTGDAFLGGDDVDRTIVEQLAREAKRDKGVDLFVDPIALDRLRRAAQAGKHELSLSHTADLVVPRLAQLPSGRALTLERTLRRDELELWAAPMLRRLEAPCLAALERAGRTAAEVDEVLLVGGMTRMPAVQERLARAFGRPSVVVPNPDEVVAIGAALEVARLEGRIEGILLIDVCARGVSISVGDGPRQVAIPGSTVIPTREHRLLATSRDGQRRLEFDLWEGDGGVDDQRHLGRYAVVDLADAPAGEILIMIELTLDVDGTLRLAATELVSGERPQLEAVLHAGLGRADVDRLAGSLEASPR